MSSVTVERTIAASAQHLYEMVSDLSRMGEWSPENTGGQWVKGASGPAVGARFVGTNRNGKKSWKTQVTVTEAAPGERFAFAVSSGPIKVATWSYEFTPDGPGTRVTETWTDQRGWLIAKLGKAFSGVDDRAAFNRQGMEATLAGLAAAAVQ